MAPTDANWRQQAKMRQQKGLKDAKKRTKRRQQATMAPTGSLRLKWRQLRGLKDANRLEWRQQKD